MFRGGSGLERQAGLERQVRLKWLCRPSESFQAIKANNASPFPDAALFLLTVGSFLLTVELFYFSVAIRATIYRSLRAQNRKKVSKRVFWGVRKKVPENTRKSQKIPKIGLFGVFFDFFGYFRGLFCGPPKRLFLRLFCDSGPGGPGDSCKWSLGSQL